MENQTQNPNRGLYIAALVLMILTCAGCLLAFIMSFCGGGLVAAMVASTGEADADTAAAAGAAVTIIYGIASLIPLAWTIPMTVHVGKRLSTGNIGVGFKVCTLIFVNVIAGILLLCASEPNNN